MSFNHRTAAAAALVAVTLFASAALAAPEAGHRAGAGMHEKGKMNYETVDANHDGAMTLAELKASLTKRPRMLARADKLFARIDANHDGKVTKAEYQAWRTMRRNRAGKPGAKPGAKPGGDKK